ncbi:MAG: hypothetical protein IJC93_03175 [Clostridia bacterium]|nr:hypothetical protein [Clostridia bacterium]
MELTMFIIFIIAACISHISTAHRRKVRRDRCTRLSREAVIARGAQIITIEECAARCGRRLYEPRRACR